MTGNNQRAGADEHPNDDATDDDGVGTVHLVGSGPSDPGLLTMEATRLIDEADAVLRDKLPSLEILEMIPVEKRKDVGRRASGEWTPQEYTNTRPVELTREGRDVARPKGGDPFVFGRGGEEAEHLADNEIPFEVVPDITPAVVGAGTVGIPVIRRDHVLSVSFVTGHENSTKDESTVDWDALATTGGTLTVLMGTGKLPFYTTELREAGLADDTPVVLIERATWSDMRVVTGTFDIIADVRDRAGIELPAITVIGEVAVIHDCVKRFL